MLAYVSYKCKLTRVFWGNGKGLEEKSVLMNADQLVRDQRVSPCFWWVRICKSIFYTLKIKNVWWPLIHFVRFLQVAIFISFLGRDGKFFYFLNVYCSLHLGPSWKNCFILTERSVQKAVFSSSTRVAAAAALFTKQFRNSLILFKAHSCLNWVVQV